MKIVFKSFLLLAAAAALAGCNVNDDNNTSLDYRTLEVNFSAEFPDGGGSWSVNDRVGILATCTRGDDTGVSMSVKSPSVYSPLSESQTSNLIPKSPDDAIISIKGDHNYSFYAFSPFRGDEVDLTALPADVPSSVNFTEEPERLYVAKAKVTGVVAPVRLEFRTLSCLVKLNVPDDIVDEDGSTLLSKMVLKASDPDTFNDMIAYEATYNLYNDVIAVRENSGKKEITVDFGSEGCGMKPGYTQVCFLIAPFTVPEGGFKLEFTAKDGSVNTVPFLSKDAGKSFIAGDIIEQTVSSSSDGIIPAVSPVEWPIGGFDDKNDKEGVFNLESQPLWHPSKTYPTATEHIWTSSQPQAIMEYKISESHPSPTKMIFEVGNFNQHNYSSGCVKGMWTGDSFDFDVPVKKFPANTTVTLTLPAYGRGAPLFWNVEYLDGEEWKTVTKQEQVSPDGQFTLSSTLMMEHGNRDGSFEGIIYTVKIPFTEEIKSGHLKIRLVVADGRYVTARKSAYEKTCEEISEPQFDGASLFAFVNKSGKAKAITIEW